MSAESLLNCLSKALKARSGLSEPLHESAFRLFNGFLEGEPDLVADLYGRTVVLYNFAEEPLRAQPKLQTALEFYRCQMPWLQAVLLKTRAAPDQQGRRGILLLGEQPDRKIRENGVWYALDLTLNRDASFYLDTRALRAWAKQNLAGLRVLNTFAYTGSLGVAALAGGASRVVQLDLSRRFLALAQTSCTLNDFPIQKTDYIHADFFPGVASLKRQGEQFDCVFLDPPFFSSTAGGRVDLVTQAGRLINKVRPLVSDGGWLAVINNALFLSGVHFMALLEALCADGYLHIDTLLPVPEDCSAYPDTRVRSLPVDPAPFNHSTKIVLLKVKRKLVNL